MTIKDFNKKYDFHDVSLENIYFDSNEKILILTITMSYYDDPWWADMNYNMMIANLVFENIEYMEDTHNYIIDDYDSILENKINENNEYELTSITYFDSGKSDIRNLKIKCKNANLIPLHFFNE